MYSFGIRDQFQSFVFGNENIFSFESKSCTFVYPNKPILRLYKKLYFFLKAVSSPYKINHGTRTSKKGGKVCR